MRKGHSLLVLLIVVFFVIFVPSIQAAPSPIYAWHTFYGSGSYDDGNAIATDGSGNIYVTGYSGSTWNGPAGQSPVHPYIGSEDIFVLKLASSGSYQWHIFYRSSTYDHGYGIATDGSGNIYVTGASWGTWNGPDGQSPLHPYSQYYGDIFVLKLVAPDLIETAVSGPPLSSTPGSSFSVTDVAMNQGAPLPKPRLLPTTFPWTPLRTAEIFS
jgi:hypothetical protein